MVDVCIFLVDLTLSLQHFLQHFYCYCTNNLENDIKMLKFFFLDGFLDAYYFLDLQT